MFAPISIVLSVAKLVPWCITNLSCESSIPITYGVVAWLNIIDLSTPSFAVPITTPNPSEIYILADAIMAASRIANCSTGNASIASACDVLNDI